MNKLMIFLLVVASSLFLAGSSQDASAWILDLSSFAHGTVMNTQFSAQIPGAPTGLGVTIYADNFNWNSPHTVSVPATTNPPVYPNLANIGNEDLAVVFDSSLPFPVAGGDNDLLSPFTDGFGTVNPPKILIIQENPPLNCDVIIPHAVCNMATDDEGAQPAGQFIFVFSRPTIITTIDFFDIEAAEQTPSDTEILMYDNFNNLINIATPRLQVPVNGDHGHSKLIVNTGHVKTLVLEMRGSGAIALIGGDDPVGGEILSIDRTMLLIADTQNNSYSILTAFTMIAAGVFGFLYYTTKRSN